MEDKNQVNEAIVSEDAAMTDAIREQEKTQSEIELQAAKKAAEEVNYKEISPIRLILRRFFRSKLSIVGIIMLLFLFAFSFLGPVVYNKWEPDIPDSTPTINTYYYTVNLSFVSHNSTQLL